MANVLWAHLLRKDATTSDSPSLVPSIPVAPHDKTGTSMRMLIHDTQANLEKFSTRLDGLLQRVDECRVQVVNANKLLDVERDKVLNEILTIANRCQSELKAHVGTPAQASTLDLVRVSQVSTEYAVQALEKRIDALQTLLQTHAHAMQSIQDQQNTLIGTILPLVPLIHSVPLQVDQIKATFSDMIASAVSTMTSRVEKVESTLVAEFRAQATSSTRIGSSNMPVSRRKRSNALMHGSREMYVPPSSPLDGRDRGGLYRGFKRVCIEGDVENVDLSHPTMPLTDPANLSCSRRSQTPRRPLADLPLSPYNSPPRTRDPMIGLNSTSREYMRPFGGGPSSVAGATPKPRIPFRPLEHMHASSRPSVPLHDESSDIKKSAMAAAPSTQDVSSKATKIENVFSSGIISVHSSLVSSPPVSAPPRNRDETSANTSWSKRLENILEEEIVEVPPPSSAPAPSNPDGLAPQSMSLRDRRAQMSMVSRTAFNFRRAETRRFLPLVPWSDDEE